MSFVQDGITIVILFLFVMATWAAFTKQSMVEVMEQLKEMLFGGDEDE